MNRPSLAWATPRARDAIGILELHGWDVNIYGAADLESFLEAVLLLPRSPTAVSISPTGTISATVGARTDHTTGTAWRSLPTNRGRC
ncbi:MAG: hypothetical protein WD050_02420 [Actinomycetota bacterium]